MKKNRKLLLIFLVALCFGCNRNVNVGLSVEEIAKMLEENNKYSSYKLMLNKNLPEFRHQMIIFEYAKALSIDGELELMNLDYSSHRDSLIGFHEEIKDLQHWQDTVFGFYGDFFDDYLFEEVKDVNGMNHWYYGPDFARDERYNKRFNIGRINAIYNYRDEIYFIEQEFINVKTKHHFVWLLDCRDGRGRIQMHELDLVEISDFVKKLDLQLEH